MILFLLLLAAQVSGQEQALRYSCTGSENEQNCRNDNGDTYIERRLVDQIVRQGTMADGSSWTEYLTRVFDGERLEGSDSNGRHWSEQCNPRFGITGTNRLGATVSIPPPPRVPVAATSSAGARSADRFGPISNPIGPQQPPADACAAL